MNARGERILIFGDSLTQHASGGNPVWDVNAGSNRSSSAPGDLLASLLLEQGAAAVRTNALVSRSAYNFWSREPAQQLIQDDLAWRPTKIIFVLGTNDVGLAAAPDAEAFQRLVGMYKNAGAELWAIGPFTNRLPTPQVDVVAGTLKNLFGWRFIDGRPISTMIAPGPDGIHYTPTSARLLALNMADALLSAGPLKSWMGVAIGMMVVVGVALVYTHVKSKHRGLAGVPRPGVFAKPGTAYERRETQRFEQAAEILDKTADALDADEPTTIDDVARRMGYPLWTDEHHALALLVRQKAGQASSNKRLNAKRYRAGARWLRRSLRAQGSLGTVEVVDGKRWGGSTNELIRSGYRVAPCKSGLDKKGTARCWSRGGLGATTTSLPPGATFIVERAAAMVPKRDRFGYKAFISDVYRHLPKTIDISLNDFKRELVRMHQDENVVLARADLVAAMDPAKVKASETKADGAQFHFVVLPDERAY